MATHSISIDELTRDLPKVLARVRAGESIRVEDGIEPPIILQATQRNDRPRRTVSETLAIMEALEKERGEPLRMGADFADDLEGIVNNRKPSVYQNSWD